MHAGVCGEMACANLGFIVHTLCHYCYCMLQATRSQSIWRGLEELQVSILIYSVGFLGLQLIHFLALSPQVMVYSARIVAEHIAVESGRSISYGVRVVVSPFPDHNYWRCGMGFLKLFSSCCSQGIIIWSIHADLSGSGLHKLITLSLLEHCGGEPEQAENGCGIGHLTSK